MPFTKQSVDSSMFDEIGYNEETNTLMVVFVSGKTYEYEGVTPEEFNNFSKAESLGRYFRENIRFNYTYKLKED